MRVLRATTVSRKYKAYYYRHHPGEAGKPYAEQARDFEWDSYAEVGLWKLNLEKIPGYTAEEYYINQEQLQRQWAKEHKVSPGDDPVRNIITAQVAAFRPDVIFEDDDQYFNPPFREKLRKQFPFIKHFVAWDGYIKSDIARFRGCSLILTCVEAIRRRYQEAGFRAEVLPFGFEPSILDRIKGTEHFQLSFVGNIIPDIHSRRLNILYDLDRAIGMDSWISNFSHRFSKVKSRLNYYRKAGVGDWHKIYAFESGNHGDAYGLKMYTIFRHSDFTLNIHGDQVAEAGNMRLLEASGCGTCLVTDDKPNIRTYFEPDREVVTFRSSEEAIEKIRYLSEHTEERVAIARAGQQKVFERFSFFRRAEAFNDHLMKLS